MVRWHKKPGRPLEEKCTQTGLLAYDGHLLTGAESPEKLISSENYSLLLPLPYPSLGRPLETDAQAPSLPREILLIPECRDPFRLVCGKLAIPKPLFLSRMKGGDNCLGPAAKKLPRIPTDETPSERLSPTHCRLHRFKPT